jgi:hypothetical protein
MRYQVLDEKGILYREPDGSRLKCFSKGSYIANSDINRRVITQGGIDRLIKYKRIKAVKEEKDVVANNKKAVVENKK